MEGATQEMAKAGKDTATPKGEDTPAAGTLVETTWEAAWEENMWGASAQDAVWEPAVPQEQQGTQHVAHSAEERSAMEALHGDRGDSWMRDRLLSVCPLV